MSLRIYGNRQLKTLPGQATRPTPARVREALFNIWQGEIHGARWLDLCAGSGAMGAEALCRGAVAAIAIDQSAAACRLIQQNWQQVAQPDQSIQVIRGNVVRKLAILRGQTFDRIYFDPPYASDCYEPVLDAIATLGLLESSGELAAEHNPQNALPPTVGTVGHQMAIARQKRYGNTALTFYQWLG
jgi:16S rRNA (guanine(966)-N(2))-methyltransferase RsmD